MKPTVHIVLCVLIVVLAANFSTTSGNIARGLSLPGSAITAFYPWGLLAIYAAVIAATRKSHRKWTRGVCIAAVFVLAVAYNFYPGWLVEKYAQKIEISSFVREDEMFLRPVLITRFEQLFRTPTAQLSQTGGGPWLIVPRSRYSESMISFLKAQAQEKPEPDGAANRGQPVRPETNQTSAAAGPDR